MTIASIARVLAITALALAAATLTSAAPDHPRAEAAPVATAYDFTPVTDAINDGMQSIPLSGASMLIVKGNQTLYEQHFGAYGPTTAVFIASATKWLSAAAFMTLVDDGLVSLDDPVSDYLPEWTGAAGTITMRQLWAHTSGLPADHTCMDSGFITLANCVEQIRLAGLIAAPGAQFYYGGASMHVAGRVAEVVTGQSWAAFFSERIATPLGMTSTIYYPSALNPRIAGGALSTLHDYGRFMAMLRAGGALDGVQVLQPATVAAMQQDQTEGAPIAYTPHFDTRRYGIGEWRDLVAENGDAIQLSSQGAFGFSPWLDLQRGYFAVFLVQNSYVAVYGLVAQLQATIRGILDAPFPVGGATEAPAAADGGGTPVAALVAFAGIAAASALILHRVRRTNAV